MKFIKLLAVCIFVFFNTNALSNQDLDSYTNQKIVKWVHNIYTPLPAEQQITLYALIGACADFSQNLATFVKLNSLLTIQSVKVEGMALGIIHTENNNESLFENVSCLRSLSNALVQTHEQLEQAMKMVEYLYEQAEPMVQDIFRKLCDSTYCLVDQYLLLSEQLEKLTYQNFDGSTYDLKYLFDYASNHSIDPLHHRIIDHQSNLISILYKKSSLNYQAAQLYFDMLNMYVNILDTYRTTIDRM